MGENIYMVPGRLTTTATVHSAACFLGRILIGTDGVSDPVVAVYNDTKATDETKRVIPSVTYDASALGLNGVVLEFAEYLSNGLHITIANIGSGEVIYASRLASNISQYAFR